MNLASLVPAAWQAPLQSQLSSPQFAALEAFVAAERAAHQVFPPEPQVFAALEHLAPAEVKVVIVGQDPYPTLGNANGLAFSVSPGVKVPASLKNIFAGLAIDVGTTAPPNGDLTQWTRQGVLLLNTVLTVREGEANSHRKKGWEALTRAVLEEVNRQPGPVVFLSLGLPAQKMAAELVDASRHEVISLPHPSPLNGKAFVMAVEKDRPFSRINRLLVEAGRGAIDWQLR